MCIVKLIDFKDFFFKLEDQSQFMNVITVDEKLHLPFRHIFLSFVPLCKKMGARRLLMQNGVGDLSYDSPFAANRWAGRWGPAGLSVPV